MGNNCAGEITPQPNTEFKFHTPTRVIRAQPHPLPPLTKIYVIPMNYKPLTPANSQPSLPISSKVKEILERQAPCKKQLQTLISADICCDPVQIQGKHKGQPSNNPIYIQSKQAYYSGQLRNSKPNGSGKLYFDSGAYFEGEFNHGQVDCVDGIFIYPDGSYYRGEIRHSRFNGKGKFIKGDGIFTYNGNWLDDKPHGQGQESHIDGSKYIGGFKEGLKSGDGKYYWGSRHGSHFPDEKKDYYEGKFEKGYMMDVSGTAKLYLHSKEEYYIGMIKKNKRQGHGELRNSYGVYIGQFYNDMKSDNNAEFKYKDGKVYRGGFQKNQPYGKGCMIFPNGQAAEGVWDNGENVLITKIDKREIKNDSRFRQASTEPSAQKDSYYQAS